ncbi:2-dehydro-3-deoxygalactonokinase, partial [Pseudomonas sp. TNT11]
MPAQLIALDWGTSSLRAYKLGPAGVVLEQRALALGIMHLPSQPREIAGVRCSDGFELAFDAACGDWLDAQLLVYSGAPHGLTDTHKQRVNAD